MKNYSLLFLFSLGLIACGESTIGTKKYYFPYANFIQPKIYQYNNLNDTNATLYWYFKTEAKNGDTTFVSTIYNSKFKITSVYFNEINDKGSNLKQMFINLDDSTAIHQCTIKEKESFIWKIKPLQPFTLSFSLANKSGSESEEIVTERSFEKKKETVEYDGKLHECVVVKEKSLFNHIKVNRTITEEQERTSYFAEGIGLIQFETFNADLSSSVYSLKKILNEQEWKTMIAKSNVE